MSQKALDAIEAENDELTFRGQRPDERIVFILRQHPFILFHKGLVVVACLFFIGLAFILIGPGRVFSLSTLIFLPVALYVTLTGWYTWSNTTFVLSNHRIIACYQKNWLSRNVSETELENIVSVEHTIEGLMKSMFNFGTLNIRSSGAVENEVLLENVYDPYGVQQKILDYAKKQNPD